MTDIAALKAEIDADPLTRGYSGMTDQQVTDDLNTEYRSVNRSSMTGDEIFNSADPTEYNALTDAHKNQFLSLAARDGLDPFASNNQQMIIDLFGGGSTTVTTLQANRVETVSRGEELGFGFVSLGSVIEARAL